MFADAVKQANSEVNEISACAEGILKCNHTKTGTSNTSETPASYLMMVLFCRSVSGLFLGLLKAANEDIVSKTS